MDQRGWLDAERDMSPSKRNSVFLGIASDVSRIAVAIGSDVQQAKPFIQG
jgi:hypothetical protein